jgi:hypothetical protein
MCACRETDVRKSAEKFHPFYAAAVFPWWLNALYLELTVQEKLRSSSPSPFLKVEGCCG